MIPSLSCDEEAYRPSDPTTTTVVLILYAFKGYISGFSGEKGSARCEQVQFFMPRSENSLSVA